jgi:hypothetical protein
MGIVELYLWHPLFNTNKVSTGNSITVKEILNKFFLSFRYRTVQSFEHVFFTLENIWSEMLAPAFLTNAVPGTSYKIPVPVFHKCQKLNFFVFK